MAFKNKLDATLVPVEQKFTKSLALSYILIELFQKVILGSFKEFCDALTVFMVLCFTKYFPQSNTVPKVSLLQESYKTLEEVMPLMLVLWLGLQ